MAENSNIEWTDHTFNPWVGCAKVSAGCKNCYAETLMDTRYGRVKWGVNGTRSKTAPGNWKQPLKWNKDAAAKGIRYRVFCSSLADVCEDRQELVPWREDLKALIRITPHLQWLILTKRPENLVRMFGGEHWPNVDFGTSVEDQSAANARIPELLKAAHLCRFTFLSCEPLLGPVKLNHVYWFGGGAAVSAHPLTGHRNNGPGMRVLMGGPSAYPHINWVIAGGESGPGARPMHPDWARSLRDQCEQAGVPFLFKQWGEWMPADEPWKQESPRSCADNECWLNLEGGAGFHGTNVWRMRKVGKHKAGRMLDGVEHNGFPTRSAAT